MRNNSENAVVGKINWVVSFEETKKEIESDHSHPARGLVKEFGITVRKNGHIGVHYSDSGIAFGIFYSHDSYTYARRLGQALAWLKDGRYAEGIDAGTNMTDFPAGKSTMSIHLWTLKLTRFIRDEKTVFFVVAPQDLFALLATVWMSYIKELSKEKMQEISMAKEVDCELLDF